MNNSSILTSEPQILGAPEARAAFPMIVGDVVGAEVFAPGTAIVQQGPRAYAVIVGRGYVACCPTRRHAALAIARALER
jgi:hypothetical protein